MSHCMQNFTFLQIRLSGILIGGSPSNALLADPEQALPGELGRLSLTASHLMASKAAIEMIVYFKTQIAFPRTIYKMDLKLLLIAFKKCCHVKETYLCAPNSIGTCCSRYCKSRFDKIK